MLGIHWPEFMLIAVVTVLVVGPKELPRVLRTITRMMRKIQGLSKEFQSTMNDLAKEADLDDMKKDFTDIESRIADMRVEDELDKTLDSDNKIASMFTGDVIGTELAEDANKPKPEVKDDLEEQTDSEVKQIEAKADPDIDVKGDDDKPAPTAETTAETTAEAKDAPDPSDDGSTVAADDDSEKAAAPGPVKENASAATAAGA